MLSKCEKSSLICAIDRGRGAKMLVNDYCYKKEAVEGEK
jgi:hypothetical protein